LKMFLGNMLLLGKVHLPTLLLPLLVLSVTFTSKPVYPDILLHRIISVLFIICVIMVFCGSCRSKILVICIPTAVVLLRILRLGYGDEYGVLEKIYLVPYSILLIVVGTKMVREYPLLMLRQIVWICAISIILSLMQIMGVQWAQSFTNFYWLTGGTTESFLFVPWSKALPVTTIQLRPVGFASANNIVSQYLLFFYAFSILWFADKKQRFRPPLIWLFIISFACALTGAKVVLAGIVLINIAAVTFAKGQNRLYMFRVLLTTSFSYFLYWFLFPGFFVFNFNIDLFAYNAMLRLKNLMSFGDIPYAETIYQYLSQFQTGEYIGEKSVTKTVELFHGHSITGLGTIMNYLPIIIYTGLLIAPFWFARLQKLARGPYVDMQKLPIIMLVAAVASSAGGPFLGGSYFWFFFSFTLYPLSTLLLREPKDKSFGHHIPGISFSRSSP